MICGNSFEHFFHFLVKHQTKRKIQISLFKRQFFSRVVSPQNRHMFSMTLFLNVSENSASVSHNFSCFILTKSCDMKEGGTPNLIYERHRQSSFCHSVFIIRRLNRWFRCCSQQVDAKRSRNKTGTEIVVAKLATCCGRSNRNFGGRTNLIYKNSQSLSSRSTSFRFSTFQQTSGEQKMYWRAFPKMQIARCECGPRLQSPTKKQNRATINWSAIIIKRHVHTMNSEHTMWNNLNKKQNA